MEEKNQLYYEVQSHTEYAKEYHLRKINNR